MIFDEKMYLEELRTLVNTDSGTKTIAGVSSIADILSQLFTASGWSVSRVDLGPEVGPGLFVSNVPDAKIFDVLLVGHMDTVFPPGTAHERPMTIADGKVFGPGVSDMKSGLLSILWALRMMGPEEKAALRIAVVMNPDEETGSLQSHEWIASIARRSKRVLVCEAARSDGSLVKARKGMARYRIVFNGVAAHAGNDPEKGRSAITALAHAVLFLTALQNEDRGTTINTGVITGGEAANVVAEHAEAVIDIRFRENGEFKRVRKALYALPVYTFSEGVTFTIFAEAYLPAMSPTAETEVLMRYVENIGQTEGIDIGWSAVGGGSDANAISVLGIPTLDGFGPIGAGFHSQEEYLELSSIASRTKLLASVIKNLHRLS